MGKIVSNETHKPRSSSMSLALRWKHEDVRTIIVIAVIAIIITLIAVLTWYNVSKKTLTVFVDGKEIFIETRLNRLRNVLDEYRIVLGTYDVVSKSIDTEVANGDQIIIERAFPIQVMVDGKKEIRHTTKKSVHDVLAASQVLVSSADKVYPSKGTFVAKDMSIRVVRISKKMEERKIKVPFQVLKQADAMMFKGKTKAIRNGREGLIIQKIQKTYEDGKFVCSRLVDKSVRTKPINQIVIYGTKKRPEVSILSASDNAVSGDSRHVQFKKMLKNVQLTAYTEVKGSGITKTASGTTVLEGRTIAVDRNVIPLGWWVYIEGFGFRRAEDTGQAVKGKIIDIYFKNRKTVNKFGRKKGYTVYVIGPVKPKMS